MQFLGTGMISVIVDPVACVQLLGDLVFTIRDTPHEGNKLRQLQPEDVSVDGKLSEIGAHILRAV